MKRKLKFYRKYQTERTVACQKKLPKDNGSQLSITNEVDPQDDGSICLLPKTKDAHAFIKTTGIMQTAATAPQEANAETGQRALLAAAMVRRCRIHLRKQPIGAVAESEPLISQPTDGDKQRRQRLPLPGFALQWQRRYLAIQAWRLGIAKRVEASSLEEYSEIGRQTPLRRKRPANRSLSTI
jgi:hypothetical protein